MTGYIILGSIIVISILVIILIVVVNKNRNLKDQNEIQDHAIEQRDDNKKAYQSLHDTVADIKKESTNDKKNIKAGDRSGAFNRLPKR
jgi:predicted Holliday junction resolvase-like endonuclease